MSDACTMTPEEMERLKQALELRAAGTGFITLPSFFMLVLGLIAVIYPMSTREWMFAILAWPTAAGLFFFAWLGFRLDGEVQAFRRDVEQDLKSGACEHVEGPVQAKQELGGRYRSSYLLRVGEADYLVDVTTYTRYDVGDPVRLTVSEVARVVLAVVGAGAAE